MKIKNKKGNIIKDNIKRKKFLNTEIKKILLKSLINNKNVQPIYRSKAFFKLSRLQTLSSISKQNNNICLKTGRIGGVYNTFNFSRHFIKKLGINNNLQNYKITGW